MTARLARLRERLRQEGLDALLVTEPHNRRYVSGFTGTSGVALVTEQAAVFLTDFRYLEQARAECAGWVIVDQGQDGLAALREQLVQLCVQRLGFDPDDVSYTLYEQLAGMVRDVPGLALIPARRLVEDLRVIKDEEELACIARAAAIADAAFAHILGVLRPGLSEWEVAWELETFMRRQGASCPSFTTIVASGWRSSLPHGVASEKVLAKGEFVTLDFGAVYQGYCSDITRTVVLGNATDEQRKVYSVVLDAQQRALDEMQAGMTGAEIDRLARDVIADAGFGDAFGHSLGHGIGLDVHEEPRLSWRNPDPVPAGTVVTVEPGIYLPGWGGVRIEDDVWLAPNGEKRLLTHADKRLICL
ncbi:peptidase M24 [Alicyclobacillus cellulosilyticus]|uniref:Peptidase M24 n=1 Tax=Alicyclobacillus cellulosilyticus TaxID=1003997 RepID=A0A917K0P8_9BACL|nr:aminopeptidase P family protein [Alicyclobacillus cellulosilyticus]GGI96015.1 peptidase M24 [Alicyclobacillus cellulosilyticus]